MEKAETHGEVLETGKYVCSIMSICIIPNVDAKMMVPFIILTIVLIVIIKSLNKLHIRVQDLYSHVLITHNAKWCAKSYFKFSQIFTN